MTVTGEIVERNTDQLNQNNGIQTDMEIDDMLVTISAIEAEIARYEELKAHRVSPIDREIERLSVQRELYRNQINIFMTEHNEKSLKYPGLGTVSRRAGKGKWVVADDEKLLTYLYEQLKEKREVLEKVVKAEPKIVKKELDKVLATLPDVPVEAAVFQEPQPTLSITFEKNTEMLEKTKEVRGALNAPPAAPTTSFDELSW